MKIITPFTCICKTVTNLKIKPPSLFSPVVMPFTCGACKSEFMLRYRKLKKNEQNGDPREMILQTKTLGIGDKAEAIRNANEARKQDA